MNVLSLFDGMSCGQIALNRIGITPTKYYASEIDKYYEYTAANEASADNAKKDERDARRNCS